MKQFLLEVWLGLVVLTILLMAGMARGECQPVVLNRGEGIDWNCRLFRRVKRNGVLYIERLRPDRTVQATEAVDCSKAVIEDGTLEYQLHVIVGEIYCGPAPRRKHEANATRQIARASKARDGAGAANHPAH